MDNKIFEIFIPGPAGRLEAKYYKSKKKHFSDCAYITSSSSIRGNNE